MQDLSKFLVNIAQNVILRQFKRLTVKKQPAEDTKLCARNVELFFKESKFVPTIPNILTGKVALVTGGTSSLGVMCIKEFLRGGMKGIMIADTSEYRGRETLKDICEEFGSNKSAFVRIDLTNVKLLRNAFHLTRKHFNQIDIVLNIADEIEYAPWNEQVEKNLKGLIRSTLLGYEYLGLQNGGPGGFIINVVITRSLDDKKTHPVAVGTKYYVTHFGKAMSEKYQNVTGVKVISAVCNSNHGSISEELSSYQGDVEIVLKGKTLTEMLKLSESGSVWMFQCLQKEDEQKIQQQN